MKADATDDGIRSLYQETRHRDSVIALPFDRVAGAPECKAATPVAFPSTWPLRLAAAAALIALCAGAALFFAPRREKTPDMQAWAALSKWQASTDGLLTMSGMPLGSKVTTTTDAWVGAGASESDKTQNNKKEEVL